METEKHFSPPRFLCRPTLSLGPHTQSLSIVLWSITLHVVTSCEESHGFDRRSVEISDGSVVISEIVDADGTESSERNWSVRKLLCPFAQASAKCRKNGPSMHIHLGIGVQQTPTVVRVSSSFGRAGEPTIALKLGGCTGRTNRARNESR